MTNLPPHIPQTIDQRRNLDGFPKAREMVEMKPSRELSLQTGRVLNAMIENALPKIADDVEHEIAIGKLHRTKHKSGEHVRDSVIDLMTTYFEIPTVDKNGLDAVRRSTFIADNEITINEDDPRAILKYRFPATVRQIIKDSRKWGRLKGYVIFAFSSKYALTLYEAICVRINLQHDSQFFTDKAFRELLQVPDGKYPAFPQLRQWVIEPALLEVNGLSDFVVEIEPKREGGMQRGKLQGFTVSWRKKDKDEWSETMDELSRPRVGRKARLKQTVETLI